MQEAECDVLKRLHEELIQFIEAIGKIPYLALPSKQPENICFSEKIKELSGYDADEISADSEQSGYTNGGIPLYQKNAERLVFYSTEKLPLQIIRNKSCCSL